MEERIFKADAKVIVDTAFNNRLFKDELTRDDFNSFEDIITFMLQSRFESYLRLTKLADSIEKRVKNEPATT